MFRRHQLAAFTRVLALALLLGVNAARAHDVDTAPSVVIDTDLGLDDAVMLAMALQSNDIDIVGIVFTEGACGREKGVELLERLLDRFNRRDIALYAPCTNGKSKDAPPFRPFVESALSNILSDSVEPFHWPFVPSAYTAERQQTTVAALGPLTNLAAAIEADPTVAPKIAHVLVAASPTGRVGWNIAYDKRAFDRLKATQLSIGYLASGPAAPKPEAWSAEELDIGPRTAIGEQFFSELMAENRVREHYLRQFTSFHDELAHLYLVCPACFSYNDADSMLTPRNPKEIGTLLEHCLAEGRQRRPGVVLAFDALPDAALQYDVAQRKSRMIAHNGRNEWVAQLLMNELHDHLGAYSIIGVKMGLRAAELLNAPPHAMTVVSHCAEFPPVSCLNDGIIVGTGCTPGRNLFAHQPGPAGATAVTFAYNGRTITLTLKDEYRNKVRSTIKELLEKHRLEDPQYWAGVRTMGLMIWEEWHRRDIFDVQPGETPPSTTTQAPHEDAATTP